MTHDHTQGTLFEFPTEAAKSTEEKHHKPPKIPLYAFVERGDKWIKGRVLSYEKNGYFTVLLPNDVKVYKHRTVLKFTNSGGNWQSTKKAS